MVKKAKSKSDFLKLTANSYVIKISKIKGIRLDKEDGVWSVAIAKLSRTGEWHFRYKNVNYKFFATLSEAKKYAKELISSGSL